MPTSFPPKPPDPDALDFSPPLLRLTDSPPNPLGVRAGPMGSRGIRRGSVRIAPGIVATAVAPLGQ